MDEEAIRLKKQQILHRLNSKMKYMGRIHGSNTSITDETQLAPLRHSTGQQRNKQSLSTPRATHKFSHQKDSRISNDTSDSLSNLAHSREQYILKLRQRIDDMKSAQTSRGYASLRNKEGRAPKASDDELVQYTMMMQSIHNLQSMRSNSLALNEDETSDLEKHLPAPNRSKGKSPKPKTSGSDDSQHYNYSNDGYRTRNINRPYTNQLDARLDSALRPLPKISQKNSGRRENSLSNADAIPFGKDVTIDQSDEEYSASNPQPATVTTSEVSKMIPATKTVKSKPGLSIFSAFSHKTTPPSLISRTTSSSNSENLDDNESFMSTPKVRRAPSSKAATPKKVAVDVEESLNEREDIGPTFPCKYCQRAFVKDRLQKHELVCQRTIKSKKRRGSFDPQKMRLKGTEMESFNRSSTTSKSNMSLSGKDKPSKSSNWRQKHEQLRATLQEARKMQSLIAQGVKPSDLPSPKIAENTGKECSSCGRKFAEGAWERHTKICSNLKHGPPRRKPTLK